jgi:hypothetical protein
MHIQSFDSLVMAIKENQIINNQVDLELSYGNFTATATLTPDGQQVVIALPHEKQSIFLSKMDTFPSIEINATVH